MPPGATFAEALAARMSLIRPIEIRAWPQVRWSRNVSSLCFRSVQAIGSASVHLGHVGIFAGAVTCGTGLGWGARASKRCGVDVGVRRGLELVVTSEASCRRRSLWRVIVAVGRHLGATQS